MYAPQDGKRDALTEPIGLNWLWRGRKIPGGQFAFLRRGIGHADFSAQPIGGP